ncbi:cytochrome c [Panacibacter sp. DH6]|uniref:Cytochrome c n=1 Tax=Panacibacter microcysteis TaxID=2793269 RepID=A0A931E2E1_9BACT|nr:c-type cytochrome [Panacibacter microcysteis]MBG9377317.1 cytochrome c [Panacibacter microcysteis]
MKKVTTTIFVLTAITLFSFTKPAPPQDSKTRGKALYETYCLTCHQDDGSGVPKLNPPLSKTTWVNGDKKKLIKWVLSGSTDKVPIDGVTYDNNMPPQDYLKDEEIADVLTYVRSSFGNKSSAVTPAEVKAVRATIK